MKVFFVGITGPKDVEILVVTTKGDNPRYGHLLTLILVSMAWGLPFNPGLLRVPNLFSPWQQFCCMEGGDQIFTLMVQMTFRSVQIRSKEWNNLFSLLWREPLFELNLHGLQWFSRWEEQWGGFRMFAKQVCLRLHRFSQCFRQDPMNMHRFIHDL